MPAGEYVGRHRSRSRPPPTSLASLQGNNNYTVSSRSFGYLIGIIFFISPILLKFTRAPHGAEPQPNRNQTFYLPICFMETLYI